MMPPRAVLLDVGGVFHLPSHEPVVAACARGGVAVEADRIDLAHYEGCRAFHLDYEGELPWSQFWTSYVERYVATLVDDPACRAEVHQHVDAEFSSTALWDRVIPGAADALRSLEATGVRLGIISNHDGSVAARLRGQEILQVGPGPGVAVECIIDSGEVGVSKPDPRIFRIALDAMALDAGDCWYVGDMPGIDVAGARAAGLHPLVMDPYGVHGPDAPFDVVTSLHDVAALIGHIPS